jgi:hypothetical protein
MENFTFAYFLICDNFSSTKSSIFWDITHCSPLKVNRRFGGTYRLCLSPAFTLVSCSTYCSTLKMEAMCSSETSADFQRTTRHYIPEYNCSTLHNLSCENLKSYKCLHFYLARVAEEKCCVFRLGLAILQCPVFDSGRKKLYFITSKSGVVTVLN